MDHKKIWIILLPIAIILLVGGFLLYKQLSPTPTPSVNHTQPVPLDEDSTPSDSTEETQKELPMAPNFTVYDAEGNPVELSDFIGKPVVLNFWASWCGPCKQEMPDFHEKYLELGDEVTFLMVNLTDGSQETVHVASEFVAEKGYTFPVYFDTQLEAATVYGVYSIPVTIFIDAEGHGIAQATGAITAETLQKGIDMILP